MEPVGAENKMIETTCVSCGIKQILVEEKVAIAYLDVELMCDECKLCHEMSMKTLDKGLFGTSLMYCPWKCGVRSKPQDIRAHEQFCKKKKLKFLCVFEDCTKIEPIRDLIQHVYSDHTDKFIILDNTPEYEVSSPTSSDRKLILLHDKDYVGNEIYWQNIHTSGSHISLMIQHICSFKGQFNESRMSLTRFTVAATNEIQISGQVVANDQPAFSSDITPIINRKIKVTMIDPSALKLPAKLLPEFDCDICLAFLTVPIRMCNHGHSLCNDCFSKLEQCPKCKVSLSQARNFTLERIIYEINTCCKYHEAGCKERPKVDSLKKHMDRCYFRPYLCIKCDKIICYKDLAGHTNCLVLRQLGVSYSITEDNGVYKTLSPFSFAAFDELFILHVFTTHNNEYDSKPVSSHTYRSCSEAKSIDSIHKPKQKDFDRNSMILYVENFTAIKDVDYYFDITVSEPIDKKSIKFSSKFGLINPIAVPKDYFEKGRILQICLEVYEHGLSNSAENK